MGHCCSTAGAPRGSAKKIRVPNDERPDDSEPAPSESSGERPGTWAEGDKDHAGMGYGEEQLETAKKCLARRSGTPCEPMSRELDCRLGEAE